jgi:hypothetical protein
MLTFQMQRIADGLRYPTLCVVTMVSQLQQLIQPIGQNHSLMMSGSMSKEVAPMPVMQREMLRLLLPCKIIVTAT